MSSQNQNPRPYEGPKFSQMVDMRIPLWGMLASLAAGMGMAATLWFSNQQLVESVRDLKIAVQSGNTSVGVLSSETALLKFRVGTIEDEQKRQAEAIRNLPRGK